MIPGQVGENRPCEFKAGNSVLMSCMRGNFHERIVATGVYHLGKQLVERKWVGSGVGCGHGTILNIVAYC